MACGCNKCGKCGGCSCAGGNDSSIGVYGVGQAPSTTTPATKSWVPWAVGVGAAAVAAFVIYGATKHRTAHAFEENPTRKKTFDAYKQALGNMLVRRYGFSPNKAYAALSNSDIERSVLWLFQHNYNVAYAAKRLHRATRRELYSSWRASGYMPLKKAMPPMGWGAIGTPQAAELSY